MFTQHHADHDQSWYAQKPCCDVPNLIVYAQKLEVSPDIKNFANQIKT